MLSNHKLLCVHVGRLVSCTEMSQDTSDFNVYAQSQWHTHGLPHTGSDTHTLHSLTHTGKTPSLQNHRQRDNWCVSHFSRMFWVCVSANSKTSVVRYWEPSKRFSFLRANMPVVWAYFGDYFSKSNSVQDATHTACRQCGHEFAESLQCINTHQNTTLTACQLVDLVCVCVCI